MSGSLQTVRALLPSAGAAWECDLRSGAFSAISSRESGLSWLVASAATLSDALSVLDARQRRALLRGWVAYRKQRSPVFQWTFQPPGSGREAEVRAVPSAFDEGGRPATLVGTITVRAERQAHTPHIALPAVQEIVNSCPEAVVVTNVLGQAVVVNQAALRMLGLRDDCTTHDSARSWWTALRAAVEEPAAVENCLQRVLDDPHAESAAELRFRDGRIVECSVRSLIIDGRVGGRSWWFRDVTVQARVNQQLRLAKERLELGLLGSDDGVFDWNLLTDELYVSHVPGTPSAADLAEWVHPDDRALVHAAAEAHLKHQVPYDIEYRSQVPGAPIKWVRARGRALRDANGRPYRFVGGYTDITARKQAIEALAVREQEYRTVLAQLNEVVFETDANGRCSYLNPAWTQLLGYDVAKCLGSKLLDFVHPDDREGLRERLSSANGAEPLEARWITESGASIWLELRPGRVGGRSQNGRTTGTLVDVGARRALHDAAERARVAAEQANNAKSDFVAAVSHDLRTPLNAILGSNELLRQGPLAPEQSRYAAMIGSNARMLARLIDDLLDISRIEAGQIDIESTPFDPVEVLETVCEQFRMEARAKGLELRLIVGEMPATLVGDPHRLRQVLANLVGNAIKFTAAGTVTLRAEHGPSGFKCSVVDTGIGIPRHAIARVFEKFVQLRAESSGSRAGVGLGLVIAKSLIEKMGGRLWVESEEGKGSTFTFEIWLNSTDVTTPVRYPGLRGAHIALWIGDRALRDSVSVLLGRAGVRTTQCAGASAVRKVVQEDQPHLVLLDCATASLKLSAGLCRWLHRQGVLFAELTAAPAPVRAEFGAAIVESPATTARIVQLLEATASLEPERSQPRQLRMQPLRNPPRVLLVDDNPDNLAIGAAMLRSCGYVVDRATSGIEAVTKATGCRYDLVFMDVEMPDVDGFEATRRIRAAERACAGPHVPIVALTAHAYAAVREDCRLAGMDDFQTKPTTQEDLATKASRWIPDTPLVLCATESQELAAQVKRILEGERRYAVTLVRDAGEASAIMSKRRVAVVLIDDATARSGSFDLVRRGSASTPFVLLLSQNLEAPGWTEQVRWPSTPDHLLAVVEKHVWLTRTEDEHSRSKLAADILALTPTYLANRLKDVGTVTDALARSDFGTVQRVAHNLKGSGTGFGYAQLSALGKDMEQAAKARDSARVVTLNSEIERQLRIALNAASKTAAGAQ